MKRKITKRKRRNPHSPTSRENQASYLRTYLKDLSDLANKNFGRLEALSSEKLIDLISKVQDLENWMLYYIELRRL